MDESLFRLPTRTSIAPIAKVIPTTGSQPVEILCDDIQHYICKYASAPAEALFREYVGHFFVRIREITTPQAAFVQIPAMHILDTHVSSRVQRSH